MRVLSRTIGALFIIFCAGCANMSSVHRDFNVDEGKGALVDIKQRAIIVSRQTSVKGNSNVTKTIVCAEPSPDALSAYAAQLAAEANVPNQVTGKIAASFQESSSSVGLRTQSIQLLRDSLYRLCEGYMSGALDEAQYDILMRRYQKYMVALLGIEQLTGTIKAPAVAINTQGSAEVGRSLSEMRSQMESIDAKTKNLEEKKKAVGITNDDRSYLDNQITSLKADKELLTKGIENAHYMLAGGSATSTVNISGLPPQRSDRQIQSISQVVEKIVGDIINTDDTGQLCFSYLRNNNDNTNLFLNTACNQYLKNMNDYIASIVETNKLLLEVNAERLKKFRDSDSKSNSELNKIEDSLGNIKNSNNIFKQGLPLTSQPILKDQTPFMLKALERPTKEKRPAPDNLERTPPKQ